MHFNSKNISLLILGVTAIVCSRAMFALFNDPEGPNLLIVMVTAVMLYFPSLSAYLLEFSVFKKLPLAILIQIIIVSVFYLFLR
jgi:hypothetical protein